MSFEDDLKKYLNQPAIKKQMKAHYKTTGGGAADIAQVEFYAQQAIRTIIDSLPIPLRAGPHAIDYNDMTYAMPAMNEDGDYTVELRWNPIAVHRESLYEEGYPEGIENIVALFSTGTKVSRHAVFGYWSGGRSLYASAFTTYIPENTFRDPDPFISNAVSAFNNAHKKDGVTLIAPPKYT